MSKAKSTKTPILPRKKINGLAHFVALMREVDPKFRLELLEKLKTTAPHLVRLSELTLFMYEDIQRLDRKSVQKILTIVDEKLLLLAWKLSSEGVQKSLLDNMSERRRENFEKEIAALPKTLKANVYKAQHQIAEQIRQLIEKGELALSSKR